MRGDTVGCNHYRRLSIVIIFLVIVAATVPTAYIPTFLSLEFATDSVQVKVRVGGESENKQSQPDSSSSTIISDGAGKQDLPEQQEKVTTSKYANLAWQPAISDSEDIPKAFKHVLNRRELYRQAGDEERWPYRGLGYLYSRRGMALEARMSLVSSSPVQVSRGGERRAVQIQNVLKDGLLKGSECDKLTLWVRVRGPEIFAGRAQAIEGDPCYWELPFDLQVPGEYEVDVKALVWNGGAKIIANNEEDAKNYYTNRSFVPHIQCPYEMGRLTPAVQERLANDGANVQEDFQGFKLYDPVHTCCEVCARLRPHCKHWATPPAFLNATRGTNGCELYFDDTEHKIPKSKILPDRSALLNSTAQQPSLRGGRQRRLTGDPPNAYNGPPHSNDVAYFMGCGWNNWFTLEYPCLDGDVDDRIFVVEPTFTFSIDDEVKTTTDTGIAKDLPLCQLEHEALDKVPGRWVRGEYPNSTSCPTPPEDDPNITAFAINYHDPDRPHCWHRDDFSRIGLKCMEINCNLIPPESRAITSLHEEKKWFGIWRPYACDYLEYTDAQLQQCFHEKKISSIITEGASISSFLKMYLQTRLRHVSMYEGESGRKVILNSLKLVHLSGYSDKALDEFANELPAPSEGEDVYWLPSFFLSSERKLHCHVSRMDYINRLVAARAPDGYKMINAFDMSAAFTYDTATQMDGLHIIGPTMKMILTKLFHHVCGDSFGGTRGGALLES